jgi:hypothetical protein
VAFYNIPNILVLLPLCEAGITLQYKQGNTFHTCRVEMSPKLIMYHHKDFSRKTSVTDMETYSIKILFSLLISTGFPTNPDKGNFGLLKI